MLLDIQIDDGRIKHQVSRILDTQSFRSSNILSKFLYYIVSETLAGKEDSLKEYVIATNVLKRNTDFDPQLDAIVRIHARRLRNLLENYYAKEGAKDPIRISIPKGRYIPIFEKNNTPEPIKLNGKDYIEHKTVAKPTIAVIPFKSFVEEERTRDMFGIVPGLSVELTRFEEINVVSTYSTTAALENLKDLNILTTQLDIDYLITGTCLYEGTDVKITIELHSTSKKQLIWAESFYFEDIKGDRIRNYRTLIRKVMAITGGFFGLVYRDTLNKHIPNDFDHMYAIYWHNRYHKYFSEAAFHESLKAVNLGLKNNPESALLTSFKAQLYLDLKALDVEGEIDYYHEGLNLVLKAIDLDQKNQHAWQVYAWANLLGHDKKEFLRSAEKCIAINPNNTMYLGSIGFGYECAGEYEKGLELMLESIKLNPYYFWNMNIGFCLYYLSHNEFDEAFIWAEKINRRALVWDYILRATALGHLDRKVEEHRCCKGAFRLISRLC